MIHNKKNLFIALTCINILISIIPVSAQWVQSGLNGRNINCFALSGTNIFAGTNGGVFLSTDYGTSWTAANTGLMDTIITSLAVSGTNIIAGGNGGVFLSTNNGTSWTAINSGLTNTDVASLAVSGTNLFAGTNGGGIFISKDNGTSWTAIKNALTSSDVITLAVFGTNLFAGTFANYGGVLYLSTDNGTSWSDVTAGLPGTMTEPIAVSSLAVAGTNLFAATVLGISLSTNNGTSWSDVTGYAIGNNFPHFVTSLAVSDTNVFAGDNFNGVFLSIDNGLSWKAINTGLTDTDVVTLTILGKNIFAGTYGGGVWRRPLSEIITNIRDAKYNLPVRFYLQQNYPNPFNPTSTIKYSIPKASLVTIKVYDVLGNEVSTLVNENKSSGNYSVQFNASSGFSSGVYFYRMQAGSFVQTKKLLLLK